MSFELPQLIITKQITGFSLFPWTEKVVINVTLGASPILMTNRICLVLISEVVPSSDFLPHYSDLLTKASFNEIYKTAYKYLT